MTIDDFKKSTKEKHNVPWRVLKDLERNLRKPLFSVGIGNRIAFVIDDVDRSGKQILVAINGNSVMDRKPINTIESVYGIQTPELWIQNQIGKKIVIYDEKRANAYLQTYGYLALVGDGVHSFDQIVPDAFPKVKKKFSLKDSVVDVGVLQRKLSLDSFPALCFTVIRSTRCGQSRPFTVSVNTTARTLGCFCHINSDIYNRTAMLKEATVDRYLKDYATPSSPNYAQAYITRMAPADFVRLTTSKAGWEIIAQQTGELDLQEMESANIYQPIQLWIDHETGEISGHEGRHRAMALDRAGVRSIPVLLFDSGNKYSKQAIDSLTLTGQNFGKTWSDATVTVRDVQPLSYANRDAVIENFATQPKMEQTAEQYGRKTARYSIKSDSKAAEQLQREINSAGLVLTSKDNNKNNLRIRAWIKEHHPELADRVRFFNDKSTGTVTVRQTPAASAAGGLLFIRSPRNVRSRETGCGRIRCRAGRNSP